MSDTKEIIRLLRNADRPVELGSLADAAANKLEQLEELASYWRAFEEMESVPDDLIDRTNQEIISNTEGNADLDGCVVSGDWERIFETFLNVTKKRILKWPGERTAA